MSMSDAKYPNLELVEYIFSKALSEDDNFKRKLMEKRQENKYATVAFDVTVFSQIWGSTATAFDVTDNGEPTIGGCAMTKAYTTVIHETLTNMYAVFIGDRPCYLVNDPPEAFFKDLKKHNMASKKEAFNRY